MILQKIALTLSLPSAVPLPPAETVLPQSVRELTAAVLEWFSKLISEMDADLLTSVFVVERSQDRCGYCQHSPPRLKPKPLAPYRKFLSRNTLNGNERAFDEFYTEYSPRIYKLLLLVTRGNESVSRELHQTVMIKAARKLKPFHTEQELWAWLAEIARNTWRDFLRRKRSEERLFGEFPTEAVAPLQEDSNFETLHWALTTLQPAERELIHSFYFEEVAQKNLASATGRSIKAIQCELARIRQKLRKLFTHLAK